MKRGFLSLFIFLILASSSYAEVEKIRYENQHTLRFSTRSDEDDYDFYITRARTILDYYLPPIDKTVRISPFFEYQSNFDTNTWWRKEVGAEFGLSFWNEHFYWGASFQHIWQKEENYAVESLEETTEWESRFQFSFPLPWGILKDRLTLQLLDEYTYDFTRGQATYNEVEVSFIWKVRDWLKLPLGWRHTDRIHDFDSDALEFSVLFSF